jgi:hypothetical protein
MGREDVLLWQPTDTDEMTVGLKRYDGRPRGLEVHMPKKTDARMSKSEPSP